MRVELFCVHKSGRSKNMTNISNHYSSNNQDFVASRHAAMERFKRYISSMHTPGLNTLGRMLLVRETNLRKVNGDVKNAAVLKSELIESLVSEHRMSIQAAGELIASLKRSGKIFCFGNFIKFPEEGEAK